MLISVYVFALIVGAVLLGASILLGGDHDGDADADVDVDGDLDLDADGDLDLDGDLDADGDLEHGHGTLDVAHGGFDFFLWTFRSIRFWTFFLAFFGLTGLALDGLGLVGSSLVTLAIAVGMGAATGFGAASVIRHLASDLSGAVASSDDYVGKTVRVVLPVETEGVGKVRLQLKGNTVDVLATTDEEVGFATREEAMIIEMDGTRARIARLNGPDDDR